VCKLYELSDIQFAAVRASTRTARALGQHAIAASWRMHAHDVKLTLLLVLLSLYYNVGSN
jgi:hypothetical protein